MKYVKHAVSSPYDRIAYINDSWHTRSVQWLTTVWPHIRTFIEIDIWWDETKIMQLTFNIIFSCDEGKNAI